jgi:hypothetical protein
VSFRWETKDLFEGFDEDDEAEGIPAAVIWIFENDKVSWDRLRVHSLLTSVGSISGAEPVSEQG